MLWYSVNLFILLIFILLFFVTKKSNKRWNKVNDYIGKVQSTVNSVRYGNLTTKLEQAADYTELSESINRMVETLNDREKMIIEYQSELMKQNKFLEAVINSLSDGILIIDENHRILRATPKIADWFGISGNEVLKKNVFDYIQTPETKPFDKLLNNEIFIKSQSHKSFIASTMKLNLEDKKKRLVLIIKDITDQKEIETLKEDFVATLTHDLKVPIVAEANMLEFLLEQKFGAISDKQKEALLNMQTSNKELIELVQILLETYKVKSTGINLLKERFMIVPFIAEIINEMSAIAQKAQLKINFAHDKDFEVSADKIQLKRVVKNLIQNAISHSDTSTDIDVKLEGEEKFALIKITDYGKGITAEDAEKVFDKYYSTAKKFRKIGTGLGLYLSKQIMESHAGDIVVASKENISTEFCIKLPL